MEKINYRYEKKDLEKWVILTHWLWWSIESWSLKAVENLFQKNNFTTLSFDIMWHWKSEWNIEDLTLTKIYKKIIEFIEFLEDEWVKDIYLYWVSLSSIPMVKAWIDKKIKKVFLRSPALEMYAKRNRELWLEWFSQWKKDWRISVWKNYQTWWEMFLKYKFITDVLENFHRFDFYSDETKVFLCSWAKDIEVPIFELRFLVKAFKNFDLKEVKWEEHSFSKDWVEVLLKYILENLD